MPATTSNPMDLLLGARPPFMQQPYGTLPSSQTWAPGLMPMYPFGVPGSQSSDLLAQQNMSPYGTMPSACARA